MLRARDAPVGTAGRAEPVSLGTLLRRQVTRTPDLLAVCDQRRRLTYAELDQAASRLTRALIAAGVGTPVGICLRPSADLVIAVVAVVKAGGCYVPINAGYPASRLAFLMADSGASIVVTSGDLRARFDGPGVTCLTPPLHQPRRHQPPQDPARPSCPQASSPDSAAYVIYTSGSTGRPRASWSPTRNVARLFERDRDWFDFGAQRRLDAVPLCAFDFSVWEMWGALLHGGRLVVVPYGSPARPRPSTSCCAASGSRCSTRRRPRSASSSRRAAPYAADGAEPALA